MAVQNYTERDGQTHIDKTQTYKKNVIFNEMKMKWNGMNGECSLEGEGYHSCMNVGGGRAQPLHPVCGRVWGVLAC